MAAERRTAAPDRREGTNPGDNRVIINPSDFVDTSFAFGVLNTDRYASMHGANFRPGLYIDYPVQLIRVADANPLNKKGFNYMVYDGHHRLPAAQSFQEYLAGLRESGTPIPEVIRKSIGNYREKLQEMGEPLPISEYEFVTYGKDITDELIDKYPGQEHFTPAQAIKEVIEPTMQHKEIASPRIAAHVLTDWNRIVGDKLNDRYSALSALTYLGKGELKDKPHAFLEKHLQGEDVALFDGVHVDDRAVLTRGLLEMAEIVRETKIPVEDIRVSAFQAIIALPDLPQNHMDKHVQVHGFLSLPEVRRKVQESADTDAERHENRLILGGEMYTSVFQAAQNRFENRAYTDALQDPHLSFAETLEVVKQPEPHQLNEDNATIARRYETVRRGINVRNMRAAYAQLHDGDGPDALGEQVLANLARPEFFEPPQALILAKEALAASLAVASANEVLQSQAAEGLTGAAHSTKMLLTTLVSRLRLVNSVQQVKTLGREIRRDTEELRRAVAGGDTPERQARKAPAEPVGRRGADHPAAAEPGGSDHAAVVSLGEPDAGLIARPVRNDGTPDADIREYTTAAAVPIEVFASAGPDTGLLVRSVHRDGHSDADVQEYPSAETVRDRELLDRFLQLLDKPGLAPEVLLDLGRVRSKLEGMFGIDWNSMQLRPETGRGKWFADKFDLRESDELQIQDRLQNTLLIHDIAVREFPGLETNWDVMEETVRDRNGHTGRDAVDAGFSNRLAYLAGQLNWNLFSEEFRFLAANHYRLSAGAYLAEKMQDSSAMTDPDTAGILMTAEGLHDTMNQSLATPLREMSGERADQYKELLQYVIYSPITSRGYKNAVKYLKADNLTSGIPQELQNIKGKSGYESVEELFAHAILTPLPRRGTQQPASS